jgi:hypothetical protein
VAFDLQVDFPRGKLVDPLLLGLALDGSQGRRFPYEIAEVVLDAHDDGLGLSAPVDDEAFLIPFYSSEDLSELGAGSQGRDDLRDILGGSNGGSPRLNVQSN